MSTTQRLAEWAREIRAHYAGEADRPLGGYVATMTVASATHKLSRLLARCPFCTGVWVATGLTAGLVFLPEMARLAMGTFAALAGADLLQFIHAWLTENAG